MPALSPRVSLTLAAAAGALFSAVICHWWKAKRCCGTCSDSVAAQIKNRTNATDNIPCETSIVTSPSNDTLSRSLFFSTKTFSNLPCAHRQHLHEVIFFVQSCSSFANLYHKLAH